METNIENGWPAWAPKTSRSFPFYASRLQHPAASSACQALNLALSVRRHVPQLEARLVLVALDEQAQQEFLSGVDEAKRGKHGPTEEAEGFPGLFSMWLVGAKSKTAFYRAFTKNGP